VDADGYYYITGRKKELIVASNGKKIYPAHVENLFKMEPIINQVLLIGDQRPYVTALITVNAAHAASLKGAGDAGDHSELLQSRVVAEAVQAAVAHVNEQVAEFERIRRFKIVPRDFSIEQGELTPTMKIRRAQVIENHRDLVSELYLGK
jgi:long-chain acyl-CoA synthetase